MAAGISSRLGSPKQLLAFDGNTLLRHTINEAVKAEVLGVVVVLGANAEAIFPETEVDGVITIHNENWREGMSSSLSAGLRKWQEGELVPESIIFMVCDQPYVSSSLLNQIIDKHRDTGKPIVASAYKGTVGTPALLHQSMFNDLIALTADEGAKKIIKKYIHDVATVSFPQGAVDIDTKGDYDKLIANPGGA
jgi:molybdenum cofactor cytidylyltransferase